MIHDGHNAPHIKTMAARPKILFMPAITASVLLILGKLLITAGAPLIGSVCIIGFWSVFIISIISTVRECLFHPSFNDLPFLTVPINQNR
jgi:hypothetical protein